MESRALIIETRDIHEIGDLVRVARSLGRKVLNTEFVDVSPRVNFNDLVPNAYVVIVTPNGKEKTDVEQQKNAHIKTDLCTF